MFATRLIIALLLSIAGASAAHADDACASLSPLLRTVNTVFEISHAPTRRAKMPLVGELDASLGEISLIDLYGDMDPEELDVRQTAMIVFVAELSMVMERLDSADGDAALQLLDRGVPNLVRAEIARLEKQLSCSVSDSWAEEPTMRPDAMKAGSLGDAARSTDNLQFESESASLAYRQSAAHPTPGSEETSTKGGAGPLSALGFPLLVTLALLVGTSYWFRPRIRRWKKRAERHVCYREVPVRLGSDIHDLTIVDFNVGGLRIKHDGRITRRRAICFELDDVWLRGHVVWVNDCYAGIRLARPLSDEQVSMLCFNTRRQAAEAGAPSGLASA
ncbi:MAG TPA: hypothetical protein EYG02_00310 [Henriciella marina]|uniref:hypothetical protein n=1 Tax=Henriciella sp. TaxID=1968823 RepID=UPI0017905F00|nr:hypothetical protein [Henriciella sp.]HIG21079.1 hypothetical protein [Henriciella sp.]HIK63453.1 hypothetical protein [Henriciella marina]